MTNEWGPLGALAGEWEGEGGLDTAFSHNQNKVLGAPYLEQCTMKPFGPVDNGTQHLYGLDYKSSMWRGDEENHLRYHHDREVTMTGEPVPSSKTREPSDRVSMTVTSRCSAKSRRGLGGPMSTDTGMRAIAEPASRTSASG